MKLLYRNDVPMPPFGKERPRVTSNGTYMSQTYRDRKQELSLWCYDMPPISSDKLALDIVGIRPMPKSASKKKRAQLHGTYTTAKPDVDNLSGAVMDALFIEDSNVVQITVKKIWGDEPHIIVEIYEIDDEKEH